MTKTFNLYPKSKIEDPVIKKRVFWVTVFLTILFIAAIITGIVVLQVNDDNF